MRELEKLKARTRETSDGCWEWLGCIHNGYGRLTVGSRVDGTRRQIGAHRLVYELVNGPIPDGLVVRHSCDNPPCINPKHLKIGTQADNVADMDSKGRGVRVKGVEHGMAKLDPPKVRLARLLRLAGWTYKAIARVMGVTRPVISRAITGNTWREVV